MADAKYAGWFMPDQIADDAELQLREAGFGADGVLLKPARPALRLDRYYAGNGAGAGAVAMAVATNGTNGATAGAPGLVAPPTPPGRCGGAVLDFNFMDDLFSLVPMRKVCARIKFFSLRVC